MRLYRMRALLACFVINVILMGTLCLTGCAYTDSADGSDARFKIVCTTYPQYDWVLQVTGGSQDFDVRMLLRNGVDMHSYQPTVEDMYRLSSADMFIYVGGESDAWVEDALKNVKNEDIIVINMMETIGDSAKTEEIVEGMQDDEKKSFVERFLKKSDTESDGSGDEEEPEYDEHIWLSIGNAVLVTEQIAQSLAKLDSGQAQFYLNNAKDYIEKLSELDSEYRQVVSESDNKTILVGDRFPFRYLTDEYGLAYYAAFTGCSAETEASFETLVFLSGKVDELGLKTIYVTETSDERVADAIRRNAKSEDIQIITLNSMQSVKDKDIESGVSYIGIMRENLEALKRGL